MPKKQTTTPAPVAVIRLNAANTAHLTAVAERLGQNRNFVGQWCIAYCLGTANTPEFIELIRKVAADTIPDK
jgi:hypothetical protein